MNKFKRTVKSYLLNNAFYSIDGYPENIPGPIFCLWEHTYIVKLFLNCLLFILIPSYVLNLLWWFASFIFLINDRLWICICRYKIKSNKLSSIYISKTCTLLCANLSWYYHAWTYFTYSCWLFWQKENTWDFEEELS